MTFPPTHDAPTCVAHCSRRIELVPSRRAAGAWIVWLIAICFTTLTAVDLPLLARFAICLLAATVSVPGLLSMVLLKGPGAVRALAWSEQGDFTAFLGSQEREMTVSIAAGSFRLACYLFLWLRTAESLRGVFVDGSVQNPAAFRQLCRRLEWPTRSPPGRPQRLS